MSCSIKKPNKSLRIAIGVIILFVGFYFESLFGLLGFVPIIFALSGFCPLCYVNLNREK